MLYFNKPWVYEIFGLKVISLPAADLICDDIIIVELSDELILMI